jgi:hypothetical protein
MISILSRVSNMVFPLINDSYPIQSPHLKHLSCTKCPRPGFGNVVHPQTRVPYNQSTNQPGSLLNRGIMISRDVRVATGRRGGSKIQFGNSRPTNCRKSPNSTTVENGESLINHMGSWFGAPGGVRTPPRNTF